ncbi:MAG: hypothetical protein JXR86_20800 [Spirochaetales bacterium]|nr:hypothetical protein [Spirochaetales bacterium]
MKRQFYILSVVLIFLIMAGCSSPTASDLGSEKAITGFAFAEPEAAGVINGTDIAVTFPTGTDVRALVANFETTGTVVHVGNTAQISGKTVNDFTNPLTYRVTAKDGSTEDYRITANVTLSDSREITAFGFTDPAVTGIINGSNIEVIVPYRTDVRGLTAVFSATGMSVRIGETEQVSGTTANDFTGPVAYTVIAVDGSTKDYLVTVIIDEAPDVPDVSGPDYTNDRSPVWNWTIPGEAVNIRYSLDSSDWVMTGGIETTSYSPPSDLPEGSHTFEVQAQFLLGNWSESGSITTIIDITAPDAPDVVGTSLTNDQTPTWNWTIPEDAVDFRYRLDSTAWATIVGTGTTTFTPPSELSEGSYTFEIQAADAAGNWSESGFFTTIIDLTAPESPEVSGISPTNVQTPTWSWTIPDGATDIRYRLSGAEWVIAGGTETTAFSPLSDLSEGSYILEVQAQDSS